MRTSTYKKKPSNPRGAGRKRWEPTQQELQIIERMGAIGMTYREIAIVIRRDVSTIMDRCGDMLELAAIKANMRVAGNLFKMTEKQSRAAEFWLVNRDPSRWKYKHDVTLNGNINITKRPDLSGLPAEDLATLRAAAAIMGRLSAPTIDGEAPRHIANDTAAQENHDAE